MHKALLTRYRSLLIASFSIWGVASSTAYGATATQSGDWSDGATWGGSPPSGNEEEVVIPMDVTVTFDTSDEVGEIRVMGKLTVATGTFELIADSLIVTGANAELEVGTTEDRYSGDFTLTLKGEQSENFMHGAHDMGWRALLALDGGTLNLHGEDRVEWSRLGADVDAGADSITMAEAVDWRPGDEILIVSSTNDWNEMEKRSISSVTDGGTTLNLTSNLSYWHCGTIQQYTRPSDGKTWTADMRAEVGLLTRNVTIQGAADGVSTGLGAHIMVHGADESMTAGKAYVEGVEIYRGGQESLLARYPFHWHLLGGDAVGQYFNDSAVHDSFNRGITIHGTDNITVSNNFFYNTIGHTVFLEDGVEENNTITYNVVALTKRPAPGTEVTPSDNQLDEAQNRTPASYWITHPNNIVDHNVAAGGEGTGFWYIFPWERVGPSANLSYYDDKPLAYQSPMGSFNGNTVHSYMNGWDIFDRLEPDHSIKTNNGWHENSDHVFDNTLWYANDTALYSGTGGQGDFHPVENMIIRDNVMVDNKFATMLASSNTVEESVFVARSGLPLNYALERVGHRLYDGAGDFIDCYFVGFDAPLPYTSYLDEVGGATQRVNWGHKGVETDHLGSNMTMSLPDFDFGDAYFAPSSYAHPRQWKNVISDDDGTLTGLADSSLTANHKWFLTGDETHFAGSENVYHVPHKFARITQNRANRAGPEMIFTRTKTGTPSEMFYHVLGFASDHHSFAAIVNEDFEYRITYWDTQAYKPARWEMHDAEPGDVAIVKFDHMNKLTGLSPTGTAYHSVAEILSPSSNATGHYLDGNGVLWFRVIANAEGEEFFGINWTGGSAAYVYNGSDDLDLDGRTNDAEGGPNRDTDGDGLPDYADANNDSDSMSDIDELSFGLDPDSAADLRYEFGKHGADGFDFRGSTLGQDNVNGAIEFFNSIGNSPQIRLHNKDFIHVSGNEVPSITIRYKSTASGNLTFFWDNENDSGSIEGPAYTGGSGYVEHTFNVGANSQWADNTIIRLGVFGIRVRDAVTSIDWIRANGQGDLPIRSLGFLDSMIANGVPVSLRDPDQDADGDGIQNLIEFINRSDANDSGSFSNPEISIREIDGQHYPEARFRLDPSISGYEAQLQFSVSPSFQALLTADLISEVDIEEGLLVERTYRSLTPLENTQQFIRLVVSEGAP